jgi:D-glycero-D-manno-heptose 1,7-bisphosphate phosphatase
MAKRAVFLDRDHTIIEDPGYLSDPNGVRLLPGVDQAIKSLAHAGYKLVVVTNQSGVARGLVTEESLERIHAEMSRQLASDGAHLDAIYYCPFHPEGSVEEYAIESDLRKPRPGMLRKAAADLDLDLQASWMVGDSPRDVEAGQRAGCRTIRLRSAGDHPTREGEDEDVRADFTVRNLSEAAKIILREQAASAPSIAPAPSETAGADHRREELGEEILRYVRQIARADQADQFSFLKVLGTLAQGLAMIALVAAIVLVLSRERLEEAQAWALVGVVLQGMALTFFTISRPG